MNRTPGGVRGWGREAPTYSISNYSTFSKKWNKLHKPSALEVAASVIVIYFSDTSSFFIKKAYLLAKKAVESENYREAEPLLSLIEEWLRK